MQSQPTLPCGGLKYTGLAQTIGRVVAEEGVLSLWRGFPPYFLRSGGHTVFMFLFLEQYKALTMAHFAAKRLDA